MQMTDNEARYLSSLIKNKNYLEIGSGDSTVWASGYASQVDSVEVRAGWYNKVLEATAHQTNVAMHLFEPEACAYTDKGVEIWCHPQHGRQDYGTELEFSSYIQKIKELVLENNYDIILIDGNVREELVLMLKDIDYKNIFLVHDISSRNPPMMDCGRIPTSIFDIKGIIELHSSDRLYCFKFEL
jgi:predicted nuclease of predicted toxin-antitoxin system